MIHRRASGLERCRRLLREESGQDLVELTIVMPLLLLVVLAIIEFGSILDSQQAVSYLTREGANIASRGTALDTVLAVTLRNGESIRLEDNDLPSGFGKFVSADLHVHMNYGGHYLATPQTLAAQARAEGLNLVENLIVNKEDRMPDIGYFTGRPDPVSTSDFLLLHDQEFHTSWWGHTGLLGLTRHIVLPGYAGYLGTPVASLYPDNATVADQAHAQGLSVGVAFAQFCVKIHELSSIRRPVTSALPPACRPSRAAELRSPSAGNRRAGTGSARNPDARCTRGV